MVPGNAQAGWQRRFYHPGRGAGEGKDIGVGEGMAVGTATWFFKAKGR